MGIPGAERHAVAVTIPLRGYLPAALTVCVGVILSVGVFSLVMREERKIIETDFKRWANIHAAALQRGIDRNLVVTESLAALYDASEEVERHEFHQFAKGFLSGHEEIQALEWIPRVKAAERAGYERAAREDGFTDFQFTERREQDLMKRAAERDEYFPVFYVEPFKGNEAALGFDLNSNPTRKEALEKARDTGEIVTTARITLVQETGSQYGVLVFHPVYRRDVSSDTIHQRRENLKGYVLCVFRVGDMVARSLQDVEARDLDIEIHDETAPAGERILYSNRSPAGEDNKTRPTTTLQRRLELSIPGRQWSVLLSPRPGHRTVGTVWRAWEVLGGGLLFTALLGIYLLNSLKRAASVEALVVDLRLSASVLENTPEGVMITDSKPQIISVNPSFTRTTGYSEEEVAGKSPNVLRSGRHGKAFYETMWSSLRETGRWQGEIWNRRKDGDIYPEWLNIAAIKDEEGNVVNYAGIFSDLSTQEHVRERLHNLAYYDVLTGLPNRELFQDRVTNALVQSGREGQSVALMFLDLDRFKTINDSLGHTVGDELLKAVGEKLKKYCRDTDTVARLGGDEFTVVVPGITDLSYVARMAGRIMNSFAEPFMIDDHELFISASIGISLYPQDGGDTETLTKNADAAMYRAKELGRNNYQFYKAEMSAHYAERLTLENDLRKALELKQLQLAYQPQVDLSTGRIIGMEALLRWRHDTRGWVPPDVVIPVAEETGLIIPLGEWVLREACGQAKVWVDAGNPELRMAVNLSGSQFATKDLSGMVTGVLKETGLSPNNLELELTETTLMEDAESSVAVLLALKNMGVKFAIDDFGTGYSSFNYLKRFSIGSLKIDKSFVDNITTDDSDAQIAAAIIIMAHQLNLKVVAEGVEQKEQLRLLQAQGCDVLQGYLFSRPLPADEITQMLKEKRTLDQVVGPPL